MAMVPLALAIVMLSPAQRLPPDPAVPIGVWYAAPASAEAGVLRENFNTIRRAGFDSITVPVIWRDAEPRRGTFSLLATERAIAAAGVAGLKVRVKVITDVHPEWATTVTAATVFLDYVRRRVLLHSAVVTVEAAGSHEVAPHERVRIGSAAGAVSLREARFLMWTALAEGRRAVSFDDGANGASDHMLALGEVAGVVTRNQALFGPLRPREGPSTGAAVEGGAGGVEVRILESTDAMVIVGLNRADAVQKVTLRFSPEIPEAIWQNIEEGTAVNFVMGKDGPFFAHVFAPRDALVLTIRKKLR
ncbi:MAG: hypothetical protein ABIP65_06785 [Vicinamibacterales bacterium]